VARNGTGGAGRSSNRVSGPNLAGTRVSFLFMFFLSFGFGLKSEKPAIDWQSRVFQKSSSLCQNFTPSMPKRRQTRVQMDMRPLVCACFSVGLNVFFMFNWREETPFWCVCQMVFEAVFEAGKCVFSACRMTGRW
jgi:hypothetical protein